MTMGTALALTAVGAVTAAATQRLVVPRLPEPPPSGESWTKPHYATLASPLAVASAAVAGGLSALAASTRPVWEWPLLVLPAGPLASLVVVDALTTYLPRRLDRACWLLALAGGAVTTALAPAPAREGTRLTIAVLCTAAFFWVVWRLSGALGWGDVRLAPLLALGPAAGSWQACLRFLVLGTLAGAVWGLVTAAWRRHRAHALGTVFPYGPGLWIGCWLAILSS